MHAGKLEVPLLQAVAYPSFRVSTGGTRFSASREAKAIDIVLKDSTMASACARLAMLLFTAITISTRSVVASKIDLETTFPLSPDTFWRLAQSEDIFRNSRLQAKFVRQRVVEVGKWASSFGSFGPKRSCNTSIDDSGARLALPTSKMQREAHLVSTITCPLGSADTQVLQDQTLAMRDGTITYMVVDCVKGMPAVAGDMIVKTTVEVTAEENNPEAMRVRVAVNVGDFKLPMMLRWLQGRISSSVKSDCVKQASVWLNKMVESEGARKKGKTNELVVPFERLVGRLRSQRYRGLPVTPSAGSSPLFRFRTTS